MNKLKYSALLIMLVSGFSACLKDKAFLDVSGTQPIIEFSRGSDGTSSANWGPISGAELDTAIAIDIASPQVLNYDVSVNILFDPTMITAFNAANPDNPVQQLPDSCYSVTSPQTIKIPADYRIGKIPIKLYPEKINTKISYAMPFSITGVTGSGQSLLISSNAGKIFYAFIGNPIAGAYTNEWIRYNTATQTPPAAGDVTTPGILFSPLSPVKVSIPDVNTGAIYDLSFDTTGGIQSHFQVSIEPASVAGITVTVGPTIVTADPVAGKYVFNFQYLNSSGAARNITDIYTK
jgi:hypothetical protein